MWHAHRTDALAVVAAHSVRDHVQALLSDGDVDGAWAVATDDPPCYRGFALHALKVSDRVAYRECVRWLKELRRLHETIGTDPLT